MRQSIGIDSNTLTLLVEAVDPKYNPSSDFPRLAEEKKAILRTFLYEGIAYYVGPTVDTEYRKIKNKPKFETHVEFCNVLLHVGPWHLDSSSIEQRARALNDYHRGQEDCYILAEAEEMNLKVLLTNDNDFLKHLGPASESVIILRPSQFWDMLAVPKGIEPAWVPANTNPLLEKTWWHW